MIFKALFGGKFMWWVIAGLLASTVALGAVSKHYYDKNVLAGEQIARIQAVHAEAIQDLNEAVEFEQARYAALTKAFTAQQEDYAAVRREAQLLRKQIDDLKTRSPQVKEYLDTPVPPALYKQLFPGDSDQ